MRTALNGFMLACLALCAGNCAGQQTGATTVQKSTAAQKTEAIQGDKVAGQDSPVAPAEKMAIPVQGSSGKRAATQVAPQLYRDAVTSFEQQAQAAHKSGDHRGEFAAAIGSARAAETLAATDPSQVPKAEAAYRGAILAARESSRVTDRSLAANNLAVLLLNSGRNQEALQAIQDIELPESMPAPQRAVFTYNIARTYELNGNRELALKRYSDAYVANPDFTQAAESGFRLMSMEKTPQIADAVKLSNYAIRSGHASVAHERLLPLLRNWATANDAQELLAALVRCYIAENLSPLSFKEKETPRLAEAIAGEPRLTQAANQVGAAYYEELPAFPFQAVERFSLWRNRQWGTTTFAPLLNVAAKWFAENDQPGRALGRYMAAWNLTRDPQYAMEFASLIRQRPELDKNGRLLNGLLDSMFMAKGESYAKQDWGSIFQMHVAIGTIFERRGEWGANGEVRGAMFQWEHAISAYNRLHATNPTPPPAPGLHAHLATCYSHTNRPQQAAREFVLAAEGFLATGDIEEARHNVEVAKVNPVALPPDDLRRLQKVEAAIVVKK